MRSCREEKEGRNYITTVLKHGIPIKNLKINVLREKNELAILQNKKKISIKLLEGRKCQLILNHFQKSIMYKYY